MNYGEELNRSGMATKFTVGGSTNTSDKDFRGELDINTAAVALWDFANLVVEHNITDENERVLNFKDQKDVKMLDGRVGKEIGECIDDWNSPENREEVKN